MMATRRLHDLGQSLWLDNITRGILNDGAQQRYVDTAATMRIAAAGAGKL